jgi:hypothetical protein
MRAPTRPLLACALALLAAGPAAAGDLTGTWKGKWSCKGQDAQGKWKQSSRAITTPEPGVSTLEVWHPDGTATPALQARIDGVPFTGFLLGSPADQAGVGAFIGCDPGDLRTFKWKLKIGAVKAKLSWRGMYVSDDATISSCRGSWTRVDLAEPAAPFESCR